jgi:hypothetical protein
VRSTYLKRIWSNRRRRGGDDQVAAVAQRPLLRRHIDPAHHRRGAEADMVAEGQRLFVDLQRQLAGRGQNQRPAARPSAGVQLLQDGQQKRGRLAGTRRGATDQVTAGQDDRNALRLDWCGVDVPHVRHCVSQGWDQAELAHRCCHYAPEVVTTRDTAGMAAKRAGALGRSKRGATAPEPFKGAKSSVAVGCFACPIADRRTAPGGGVSAAYIAQSPNNS